MISLSYRNSNFRKSFIILLLVKYVCSDFFFHLKHDVSALGMMYQLYVCEDAFFKSMVRRRSKKEALKAKNTDLYMIYDQKKTYVTLKVQRVY